MDERLLLATWVKPATVVLGEVETAVLLRRQPPLNLDNVGQPRDRLRAARAIMAATARGGPSADLHAARRADPYG